MNPPIVYLDDIVTRLQRIERYTAGGYDEFLASELIQDAVLRNFQVIGEAAKRIPEAFRQQHSQVPWRRMTGFRDVIVHDYAEVVFEEVWLTIERDLPPLKRQLIELLDVMRR